MSRFAAVSSSTRIFPRVILGKRSSIGRITTFLADVVTPFCRSVSNALRFQPVPGEHPRTDAIAHVVRCFVDDNVVHVAGGVNPVSDIETINTELALADLAAVEKQLHKVDKLARGGDKEADVRTMR